MTAPEAAFPGEQSFDFTETVPPSEVWSQYLDKEEDEHELWQRIYHNSTQTAKPKKKKTAKRKKNWDGSAETTNVYVSNLPEHVTREEVVQFFSKCGLIKKDAENAEYRIKLYKDDNGRLKGDGLVSYLKKESVDLALKLLDDSEIKPGFPVKVTKAIFEMKGNFVPKKKVKKSAKIKKINQESELGWEEDRRVHTILKYMFEPKEAEGDPTFYSDLKAEIRAECEKLGKVEAIHVFENNPEGVVAVKFKTNHVATKCLEKMNQRWFGGRQISAEFYDGISHYAVKESEEAEKKRIEQFGNWLEDKDDEDVAAPTPTTTTTTTTNTE